MNSPTIFEPSNDEPGHYLEDLDPERPYDLESTNLSDFTALYPGSLSQKDLLTVGHFIDKHILLPGGKDFRSFDPDKPGFQPLDKRMWNCNNRSILHLILSGRRLVSTSASSISSSDWNSNDPVFNHYNTSDYIAHAFIGVDPAYRGQGLFSKLLYPAIQNFTQQAANTRTGIISLLNLAPNDDGKLWTDRGYAPVPQELQEELDSDSPWEVKLKFLAKHVAAEE